MSLIKSAMAAAAAVTLVAAPAVAHADSAASKLSVSASQVRSGAEQRDANQIGGGSSIIAILAAIAVIAGIVIAADGSNSPSSP